MSKKIEDNNFDEEIFTALFRKGANEYLKEDFLSDLPPRNEREKVEFSETFEKRMKNTINKAIHKEKRKRHVRRLPKIAAAIFILLLVSSFTVYNVEALRVKFIDMFIETKDIVTDIVIGENYSPDGIDVGDMSVPKYIPKGYKLYSSEVSPNIITLLYKDNNDKYIQVNRYGLGPSVGIDTEDADYGYTTINTYEAFYSVKNGYSNILFETDDYAYQVLGELAFEEAIKIAESIK